MASTITSTMPPMKRIITGSKSAVMALMRIAWVTVGAIAARPTSSRNSSVSSGNSAAPKRSPADGHVKG